MIRVGRDSQWLSFDNLGRKDNQREKREYAKDIKFSLPCLDVDRAKGKDLTTLPTSTVKLYETIVILQKHNVT